MICAARILKAGRHRATRPVPFRFYAICRHSSKNSARKMRHLALLLLRTRASQNEARTVPAQPRAWCAEPEPPKVSDEEILAQPRHASRRIAIRLIIVHL
jgi:hypothetical protein